jgi:Ohr subfamily peroxiredoxin
MSKLYTTEAISTGDGRNGTVRTLDGVLEHQLAVPKEMGGPGGEKTNPEQLFAAGYAACFHNGLRLIAAQRKLKLGADTTVASTVGLLALEDGRFTLEVGLSAHLPGLAQTEADELVAATHQVCPYSNSTRGNIEVTLEATV